MQRLDAETETMIPCQGGFFNEETTHTLRGEGFDASEDGTGRGVPLTVTYPINTQVATRHEALGERTAFGIGKNGDPAFTLLKNHSHAVAFQQNQIGEIRTGDVMGTLNTNTNASGRNTPMVAQSIGWSEELTANVELSGTLQYGGEGGRHDGVMTPAMQVRRLTPRECEYLQGFKPDYTLIPLPLKPRQTRVRYAADGPRYKAMGNSMAVPVMRWLGERIQMVEDLPK